MTIAYASGQILLTNGSAVVTGIDTAWQISLINGGVIYPDAEGNPLPIASVDSDIAITTATKWRGASGTYDYALVRDTSYGAQQVANANTLAQLVKEFAAGTIFKFNASGTLAGRSLFDTTPQSFSYLVSIDVEEPQLYVKASATPGDWSGPFAYGTGPVGPPPTLHFSPVVTEASGTPASIDVAGDGPYGLTFHIPRGADGDMEPVGDWTLGNNYSVKQVVGHAGSSYVCKLNHTASAANEPGVGASWHTDWDLFVAKGDKGDQGIAGPMDPLVYDPQAKHADAFARSNHTGTQNLSTITGFGAYAAKSAGYTAVKADNSGDLRFTAAATLALTTSAMLGASWGVSVTADGGDVTIDPAGAETINGQPTLVVKNGTSCRIKCDGTNFFAVMKTGIWETVGFYTLAAAASLVVNGLADARSLRITGSLSNQSVAGILIAAVSYDNGATFDTAANYYSLSLVANATAPGAGALPTASALVLSLNVGSDAAADITFITELFDFNKAVRLNGLSRLTTIYQGNRYLSNNAIFHLPANPRNAFRINASGGGTMTGTILIEKMRG